MIVIFNFQFTALLPSYTLVVLPYTLDFFFCDVLKKNNIKVMVDTAVRDD